MSIDRTVLIILIAVIIGGVAGMLLTRLVLPTTSRVRTPAEQTELMRNLLAFLLVVAFISVLPVLTFKAIPEANEQIITYMVGQLSGMALTALGFYFVNKAGQDAADAKKTDNTALLAGAVNRALDRSSPTTTRPSDDLDADGFPWDERIHSSTKEKDGDGRWIKRGDVDPATVVTVEAELMR
jgi:uncharacterized membrane protein